MSDDTPSHELVMPFVTVTSKGGPHDDASYCAGFEMGCLDRDLQVGRGLVAVLERVLQAENQPQADLIAMRRGWTATFTDTDVDGWTHATFEATERISE